MILNCRPSGAGMARSSDRLVQPLCFSSCGEEDSSDSSSDDWAPLRGSPNFRRSPSFRSPIQSPSSACRTPRVPRHRQRSITASPSFPSSPIPYAAWNKLRLCESPNTPKVSLVNPHLYRQMCSNTHKCAVPAHTSALCRQRLNLNVPPEPQ